MPRDRVPHDKPGWSGIYHVGHVSSEFTDILPPQAFECWHYNVITGGQRYFSLSLVVVLVPGGERAETLLNTLQYKEEPFPWHGKHARQTEPLRKGMALGTQSTPGVLGVVSNEIILLSQTGEEGSDTQILHLFITNAFQDCSGRNCPFETQKLFPRLPEAPDGSLTSFHTEVGEVQWTLVFLYILYWPSRMLKTGISRNTNRRLM